MTVTNCRITSSLEKVASLIQANWLFLLTDVEYLYTGNPRLDPEAKPIYVVEDLSMLDVDTETKGTQWGTGGMETKITAAVMASAAGCRTVICSSSTPESIIETISGNWVGTVFLAQDHPLRGRRRWILLCPPRGKIYLDDGAVQAVIHKRSSLFAVGIVGTEGTFSYQDAVRICNREGKELARCLVNYSSTEIELIKGKNSKEINRILGYIGADEVAVRDNISILLQRNDASEDEAGNDSDLNPLPRIRRNRKPSKMSCSVSAPNLKASADHLQDWGTSENESDT